MTMQNSQTVNQKIREILCERLQVADNWNELPETFTFKGSGLDLDSVESLEIVVGIEQTFGISIESHEINVELLGSLHKLTDLVLAKLGSQEILS